VTSRRQRLTVLVSANGTVTGAGLSCPPTCETSTAPGQPVTLTAQPANGFVLTGWGGACSGTATTCTVTMTGDKTASATFGTTQPTILPAPVLVSPANGKVLFNFPRDTRVTWQAVSGAAKYHLEAEINTGSWVPASDQTVTGTSTTFGFGGDNPGRWRVTAIAPDGTPGTTSGWRTFSYDTRLAGFIGSWTNSGGGTQELHRLTLTQTSATTATLHAYGACSPTDCDWGTTKATLSGGVLTAFYKDNVASRDIRISESNGVLTVQIHNTFLSGGGYDHTDTMSKN
jgi:hypothetical protein